MGNANITSADCARNDAGISTNWQLILITGAETNQITLLVRPMHDAVIRNKFLDTEIFQKVCSAHNQFLYLQHWKTVFTRVWNDLQKTMKKTHFRIKTFFWQQVLYVLSLCGEIYFQRCQIPWRDSLSNNNSLKRQFIEIYRNSSLSNDSLLNFIKLNTKRISNAPMQRVYRILLNPITAFYMRTHDYFIEFFYTQYHQPFKSPIQWVHHILLNPIQAF